MWISVKDKLPPMKFDGIDQHISDRVLLLVDGEHIDIGYRETFLSNEDGEGMDNWIWWFDTQRDYNAHTNVTHWQPLPPLPQEKQDDLLDKIYTEDDL